MRGEIKLISVIIPCYKQEKTVVSNIKKIRNVLSRLQYAFEIIVVVDGKIDNTFKRAKTVKGENIKVVGYSNNYGKGYALRYGMAKSRGNLVAFIDGGTDLNPRGLQMLLAHFEWYNADIIVGSKWHPVSKVKYPWWRKIVSKTYGVLVKILFGLRIRDTQLGMKFFRREVLVKVLPRLLVKKWAFDIEILSVADRLGFKRIYEAPIELDWLKVESHVSKNFFRSVTEMLIDTLAVFYRLRIVKYYDDGNQRKWKYNKKLNLRINIG